MPLYEYRCRACERRFEVLQSIGAGADGLACPDCGAGELARELSTFAAHAADGAGTAEPIGCGAPGCRPGFTCAGGGN